MLVKNEYESSRLLAAQDKRMGLRLPNQQQVRMYRDLYREHFGKLLTMKAARSQLTKLLSYLAKAGLRLESAQSVALRQASGPFLGVSLPKAEPNPLDLYNKGISDQQVAGQEDSDGR